MTAVTLTVEEQWVMTLCIYVLCNLVVLRWGVVKGNALSVAACVAGHSSALVCADVFVFVCIPGIHTKDATS